MLGHLMAGTATGDDRVDLSIWGLQAAVTRYSQDVDRYDRATELETAGGSIIDLGPGEWKVLVEAKRAEKNETEVSAELQAMVR